jgi:hypothetical protein
MVSTLNGSISGFSPLAEMKQILKMHVETGVSIIRDIMISLTLRVLSSPSPLLLANWDCTSYISAQAVLPQCVCSSCSSFGPKYFEDSYISEHPHHDEVRHPLISLLEITTPLQSVNHRTDTDISALHISILPINTKLPPWIPTTLL